MAMTHEETLELNEVYGLMTGEELRGQLGEDPEHDALINKILGDGKVVELDDGPLDAPEDDGADDVDDADDADDEQDDADDEQEDDAPAAEVPAPAASVETEPAADLPPLDLSYLAEKYDAKLAELDEKNANDLAQLMSGEIEASDYAKAQAQYLRDRDGLKEAKQAEAEWNTQLHTFTAQALKESGINYPNDPEKLASWDSWIKHLAAKDPNQSGDWYLKEAHKKVLVEFGIAPKAAETVADRKKVAPKTARTPNLSNIPPTLSGLPAAAPAASGDGGEFDHIYKLDGIKFERAIAGMNADQRARFESEQ